MIDVDQINDTREMCLAMCEGIPGEVLGSLDSFLSHVRSGDWNAAMRCLDGYREIITSMIFEWQCVEVVPLGACDYQLYLKTEHWQRVRQATIDRFGGRCAVCNSNQQLDVHHRTYERRGCETPADTILLCRGCHDLFHKNGKLAAPGVDEGSPY